MNIPIPQFTPSFRAASSTFFPLRIRKPAALRRYVGVRLQLVPMVDGGTALGRDRTDRPSGEHVFHGDLRETARAESVPPSLAPLGHL